MSATTPTMITISRTLLQLAALGSVGAVLPAAASPYADSAAGVGTSLGNTMTASATAARPRDAEWMKLKHTPTGQLFPLPFAMPKADEIRKMASGWEYSGQLEFGVIGGDADERSAQYRTYSDPDNGALLNNFTLTLKRPAGGHYLELQGGAAGRNDQYYGLEFGRYNDWKVKLFHSETPHVFTNRYKSLWNGVGTGNLTLVPGLTAGGTASTAADHAAVAAAAAANSGAELSLTRERTGIRLDLSLTRAWKAYVGYALEKRVGARPIGVVWGNAGGTAPMDIPEPVDYETEDIMAGLLHADGLNVFNLRLSASIFRNNISTVTFEEPYRIAPPAGVTTTPATGAYTQGRMDLAPSNQAYNARAEYTRRFPEFYKSSLTAVVSAGTWRQDDSLIPYTTIPNVALANVTLLPGGGWDTTGSLSRRTADQTIDTRLADLTFAINPTSALNLKAKARFHETKNASDPFLAVNPNAVYLDADATTAGPQTRGLTLDGVTGVWGRILNDGSGQNILLGTNATPAGNIPVRSNIYSSKQSRFGPTADYRLDPKTNLNFAYERENIERTRRERAKTWEDRTKIGFVSRALQDATVRASYEFATRRGSAYTASTYDPAAFSSAIFPLPTTAGANVNSWAVRTNNAFRAFDLSDRDQHTMNVRLDTMIRPDLDAGVSFQIKNARHPDAAYGRTQNDQRSLNLDLNYQPSAQRNVYGFYSYQQGRYRQTTIPNANAAVTIGLATPLGTVTPQNAIAIGAAPGGPIFPLVNTWDADSADRNHVAGFGLRQDFGKASLHVDYSYSIGRTRIDYAYTVGGAVNAANAVVAGARMPDLATDIGYLDASLRIPLTKVFSARLIYRHQKETIRDWHYTNVDATPVVRGANANALPTALPLDGGPQDFTVGWYGVMFQIKL